MPSVPGVAASKLSVQQNPESWNMTIEQGERRMLCLVTTFQLLGVYCCNMYGGVWLPVEGCGCTLSCAVSVVRICVHV